MGWVILCDFNLIALFFYAVSGKNSRSFFFHISWHRNFFFSEMNNWNISRIQLCTGAFSGVEYVKTRFCKVEAGVESEILVLSPREIFSAARVYFALFVKKTYCGGSRSEPLPSNIKQKSSKYFRNNIYARIYSSCRKNSFKKI